MQPSWQVSVFDRAWLEDRRRVRAKSRSRRRVALAAVLSLGILVCGSVASVAALPVVLPRVVFPLAAGPSVETPVPELRAVVVATVTPLPTETPLPTATLAPTATLVPTATSVLTAIPVPTVTLTTLASATAVPVTAVPATPVPATATRPAETPAPASVSSAPAFNTTGCRLVPNTVCNVDVSWRQAVPRIVVTKDNRGQPGNANSWGSAVVVGKRTVVTAYHVAQAGSEFRLEFHNGQFATVKVTNAHPESDIAVLTSDSDLPVVPRAYGDPPPAGVAAYVIGHKPGYADPPSARPATFFGVGGPIVLYNPAPATFSTLLFDSPAGGGDSGGAMYDDVGRLVGIVVGGSTDPATGKLLTHVVPASLVRAAVG